MDLQPVLDRKAAIRYISKYASKPETASDSYYSALNEFCCRLPQDLPAEHAVRRLFARMASDRDISAQEAVHLLLGDSLVGCSRSFVNLNAGSDAAHILRETGDVDDEDAAFQESFFTRYEHRPPELDNLNALLFCSKYDVVKRAYLTFPPPFTSSSRSQPRCLEHGVDICRERRKEVIFRAWPRATTIPPFTDTKFDEWALTQLRIYKAFRNVEELRTPNIKAVFSEHLANNGFPNLKMAQDDDAQHNSDSDSDSTHGDAELSRAQPNETNLVQDDYQRIMNAARASCESAPLLGFRELDVVHVWPTTFAGFHFEHLETWINTVKDTVELPPLDFLPFLSLLCLPCKRRHTTSLLNMFLEMISSNNCS
jgi:hypothetical protein